MADKLADEKDLVSAYLLEAMTQALQALQLSEHDARGTGTRAQLAEAIKVCVLPPCTPQQTAPLRTHLSLSRRANLLTQSLAVSQANVLCST